MSELLENKNKASPKVSNTSSQTGSLSKNTEPPPNSTTDIEMKNLNTIPQKPKNHGSSNYRPPLTNSGKFNPSSRAKNLKGKQLPIIIILSQGSSSSSSNLAQPVARKSVVSTLQNGTQNRQETQEPGQFREHHEHEEEPQAPPDEVAEHQENEERQEEPEAPVEREEDPDLPEEIANQLQENPLLRDQPRVKKALEDSHLVRKLRRLKRDELPVPWPHQHPQIQPRQAYVPAPREEAYRPPVPGPRTTFGLDTGRSRWERFKIFVKKFPSSQYQEEWNICSTQNKEALFQQWDLERFCAQDKISGLTKKMPSMSSFNEKVYLNIAQFIVERDDIANIIEGWNNQNCSQRAQGILNSNRNLNVRAFDEFLDPVLKAVEVWENNMKNPDRPYFPFSDMLTDLEQNSDCVKDIAAYTEIEIQNLLFTVMVTFCDLIRFKIDKHRLLQASFKPLFSQPLKANLNTVDGEFQEIHLSILEVQFYYHIGLMLERISGTISCKI